jgi:hypothetical protein
MGKYFNEELNFEGSLLPAPEGIKLSGSKDAAAPQQAAIARRAINTLGGGAVENLRIRLTDEFGQPIGGKAIVLARGSTTYQLTTDGDGKAIRYDVAPGVYTLLVDDSRRWLPTMEHESQAHVHVVIRTTWSSQGDEYMEQGDEGVERREEDSAESEPIGKEGE